MLAAKPANQKATRPPHGLEGLDPAWSRLVRVGGSDAYTWHLLDNGVHNARLTLLCVHGNPSWSYLWRKLLANAPSDVRVIAVDQLEMGFSERKGVDRHLATRVEDLCELTDELQLSGRVITVAHDWGGPISMGWAIRHRSQLDGLVLLNTSVHQPAGSPAPSVIRFIRQRGLLRRIAADTQAFITGAIEMSRPRLSKPVQAALRAPYQTRDRRGAIAAFVEDIPLDPHHPSASALEAIADGLSELSEVPSLLLWGPNDPVFSDLYLHDLEARLPHAQVHRYPGASHFVSEDRDTASAIVDWTAEKPLRARPLLPVLEPLSSGIDRQGHPDHRSDDRCHQIAIAELVGTGATTTFTELSHSVESLAAGMHGGGILPGQRVALMIAPGIDLSVALYACWRLGAVAVLVDSGLGPRGMTAALKSSHPQHLFGIDKALVAAQVLRWPGQRFCVDPMSTARKTALKVSSSLSELQQLGEAILASGSTEALPKPADTDDAVVVFTSGSTGPSKGVRYRHHQLQAQRDALAQLYNITSNDRLVAAFAPFALFGPALGISSAVPDMDVAAPGTLTAKSLANAAARVQASLVFASPAALQNVLKTAENLSAADHDAFSGVRLVMSAGAPIHVDLLSKVANLFPNAEVHTPYGMTEVLPVADISLDELELLSQASPPSTESGVCVGFPAEGVQVRVCSLDERGKPGSELLADSGVLGEIVVQARHALHSYDRLWHTQYKASQPDGWHRSGDVGHLDDAGRLWIEGRLSDVITTAAGLLTPVSPEQAIEQLPQIQRAAVVGVGPIGTQHSVAVVEMSDAIAGTARRGLHPKRPCQAPAALSRQVADACGLGLAAVLVLDAIPVDRRHNSKIDRTRLTHWAQAVLAGGKMKRP